MEKSCFPSYKAYTCLYIYIFGTVEIDIDLDKMNDVLWKKQKEFKIID